MKTNQKGFWAVASAPIISSVAARFSVLLVSCLLLSSVGWGQVSNYTFSQTVGTFTPITGGTIAGASNTTTTLDGQTYGNIPIGFSFVYNGLSYTEVGIASDGFISMGSAVPSFSYTPISTGTTNNVISAAGRDLYGRQFFTGNTTSGNPTVNMTAGSLLGFSVGDALSGTGITTGTLLSSKTVNSITMAANATSTGTARNIRAHNGVIRYQTIGTSPNRKLVVQWLNFSRYVTNAPSDYMNFQIVLYETSNNIDIVYDFPYIYTTGSHEVGLRGSNNSDYNNRSTSTNWSSTVAGSSNAASCSVSNTIFPTSGLTFTWAPPLPCAAPTSLAASVSSSTQTNTTISGLFTAASTAPTGYIVVRTLSATQPTSLTTGTTLPTVGNTTAFGTGSYVEYIGANAGSWISTSLLPNTTYYYWVFSYNNSFCTGGPAYSANATSFSQNTIACTGSALANLTYSSSTASYCTGNAIITNTATLGTSSGTLVYSISPALPTGLVINSSTGNITGTPTTAQSSSAYTITSDNGCTSTTATVNIEIVTSPTAPTSSAATSITYSGFTANWTTNGASSYQLDVATDASFTNLVTGYNALNAGNTSSYAVTGLNAGATYYYRVRSVNGSCVSANSASQTATTTAITSVGSGNWNAITTWNSGTVPVCGDVVNIANTHNVTVNSSSNVSGAVTIAFGGTLTIASGDLTVGCTLNNTPLTNNGTLTVSGGTLNVNGNVVIASGATFNQSNGEITIDGNAAGVAASSVPTGTNLLRINSNLLNLTGGRITIVDPHAGSSTSDYAIGYSTSSLHYACGTGHTTRFGNGVSTDPGGHSNGFYNYLWVSTGYLSLGNVEVDVLTGTNRFVKTTSTIGIMGNLNIISGEYWIASTTYVSGNITNNGILTNNSTLNLGTWSNATGSATSNPQTISGSGTFRNLTSSPTASLKNLNVNNTSSSGVTISTPLSISGTLTMTAGKINTTSSNLLTLGTATAAGTLSYTAGQIAGPFARTFDLNASATAVYDATTLFPVGDGTNYIPIHIDPVNGGGVVQMRGQAFNTNSGTGGNGVATVLSTDRWEALVTSGTITDCFIGLNDAQIASGNVIAQSSSASGTYNAISGASTFVSGTPNALRTAVQIPNASYSGYFTYAAAGPVITSFTPTSACPNAVTTITITGTGLGSATSVTLNGEACTITNNTATIITVTTDATPQAGNIVVTTSANSATSATAMSLYTLPTVSASSNVANNTVCSGTSVTLTGAGASSYTWNNSVTNNVAFTPSSSTTYTVTGTDANGCTNTASLAITVNQIVAITTQPSNQVVLPNANATFSVTASGTGLTYQWEENIGSGWSAITNGGIYSGATTNTLTLSGVTSSQNLNQYRVVISGTAPCSALTSNAATLTISSTAISAQPQNQTICTSSGTGTASFSITTTGTTPTYQWQVSSDGGTTWTDINGETNASLTLTGLVLANSTNQYRCSLNSGAIYSNAAILIVYDPPVITQQPSNLTVCAIATSGVISVSATGSNLTYQWQVSTNAGSTWSNVSGSNVSGATTNSLSFTSYTNSMDGYQYKVIISGSSPCSAATSNVVTINVTGIVSVAASSATTCTNSTITLTATPTASASGLSYSWSSTTGSGASTALTTNPASVTPTAAGSYTYTLATTGGSCTFSNTVVVTVNQSPSMLTLTPSTATNVCAGNIQSIAASGGTLGGTFAIGPVSPTSQGGTISVSAFAIGTYYQQFNVLQPTTLVSIDIYPTAAVGTTGSISIANSAGTILTTANYTVANNSGTVPQTVTLNYPLSVGTGYRIGQGGTAINLNRNTTNQVYPVANAYISITGNNFNPAYWYYIYNWQFSISTQQTITWSPTTDLYTNAAATTAYTGNPTTVYSKPTANRTYTATATTSNGCTSSASVTINYSGTPLATAPSNGAYVFGATSNTNYNTAANWYTYSSTNGYEIASAVPTSSDVVVIPATATCVNAQPSLSATSSITDVEIQSGAVLSLNGNTLSIAGALTGAGSIKGSATSSLSFTGSTSNTLKLDQSTPGTTNVLKNLTLSGSGTTTLGNALNITAGANSGSVTVGAGTTLTTGGYLTLKSDASGTARIAQSAGTISGNVTQERYVPGKAIRKWSFLASPVTQSLASAWQQQIHITGAGTGGTMCNNYTISGTMTPHSNGFDVTQLQNPSFYTYDAATDNFVANTTGTTAYTLTPGVGYMVLVRGDRNDATNGGCVLLSANNQAAFTSTPVTLAATGAVGQGTITKVLPAGYSFIGNPYPCEIDFPSFNTTNTSVISGGYWTYYPTNATYTFSTYNNGTSTNGGTQVIANGQSFLVNSVNGGTITFNEAHKSTTANNGNFRLTKTWDELIRVGLSNNQGNRYDEVVVRFGNDAAITKALNEYDAASVNGGDQWIKTMKEATELAIQTRPNTYQNDTVSLAIHAKNAGTYQLGFSEYQGLSATEVYLIDQQENLIQNVKALPSYEFNVAANTTTANRFKLIFESKTSGVATLATKAALQVYPNPTKDKVRITCDGMEYGAYQIKVRTITGAEVLKAKGMYYQNEVIELSLQDLAAGMYLLELTQDNGLRAVQKITKH